MEPISLVLGLSKLVPTIAGWFGDDNDAKTAETIIDVAKSVAGISDPNTAVEQIKNDPALHIQFQQAMQPVIVSRLEAQTKQLKTVNKTMRAEYASKNWYIAGWRPTFGYIVSITWLLVMLAMVHVIITSPADAPAVISAMGSLTFMWSIAMAVLGVSVQQRSKDKQLAAGHSPAPGIMSAIASRILK